eukprot:2290941-Amphidinium_carterae.1
MQACALIDEMMSEHLVPDAVTYLTAMTTCEKASRWHATRQWCHSRNAHGHALTVQILHPQLINFGKMCRSMNIEAKALLES